MAGKHAFSRGRVHTTPPTQRVWPVRHLPSHKALDTLLRLAYIHLMKRMYGFRFEVTDVETWRQQAKAVGFTLSEWIRRRCNAVQAPAVAEGKAAIKDENDGAMGVPVREKAAKPARREAGTGDSVHASSRPSTGCEHGIAKGFNCWQCGGLAKA